jgi:hypothetical protein
MAIMAAKGHFLWLMRNTGWHDGNTRMASARARSMHQESGKVAIAL